MQRFREFYEGISLDNDSKSIKFKYAKTKSDDPIQTLMGKNKKGDVYTTKGKNVRNHEVFSAYRGDFRIDSVKDIMLAIKGKNPDFDVSNFDYRQFLSRTVQYVYSKKLKSLGIDIMITPQSGSPLAQNFAAMVGAKVPNTISLPQSIYKADVSKIKLADNVPERYRVSLERVIRNVQTGKTKSFQLKKIPGPQRKFIYDFLEINPNIANKIEGKNILVVDDILTSGATLAETFRILELLDAKNIYGLTLFKLS
jgi:hypothetical protein